MWRWCSALGIGLGLACSGGKVDTARPQNRVEPVELPAPVAKDLGTPVVPRGEVDGPSQGVAPQGLAEDPSDTVAAPPVEASGTSSVVVSRARLEQELSQVKGVDDVVTFRPHLTIRGIEGFKVTGIPKDSPISGIGLLPGDVVHSVNGHSLGSMGALMGAAEELQSANRFEGEITRNGKRQTLVVQLK